VRFLLPIAVVAAALTLVGGAHASGGRARLTLVTVPHLAGVRFALDGVPYVTGPHGKVRIETTVGPHQLQILDTRVNAPGVRSTFARWEDNQYTASRSITIRGNTVLDAGFLQSVLVHFAFADRTGRPVVGRVSTLTLSNTLGSRVSFAPSFPQWLRATGIARRYTGLEPTFVQYSIQQALVSGQNVVNHSQQRFYPALNHRVTARLLLYSARVTVRDFLFGTTTGNRLELNYPNGIRVTYPLKGRTLLLSSLPRGTYNLHVVANGYVPSVSLALSKNQVLDVKVVSYLDMLLLFALVVAAVTMLVLLPRPFLRHRLREIGTGRRPTPDDLEPLKPLTAARKKLIHRYMPEPEAPPPAVRRKPAPTPQPIVVPQGGTVERSVQRLPSFETAVESLRRGRQRVAEVGGLPSRLRQAAQANRTQLRAEALQGERIELINVYMREHTGPAQETESPVPQAPPPEAAKKAGAEARSDAPSPIAEPVPADEAPAALAPVIALRPGPVEEKPEPTPVVEETPEPAPVVEAPDPVAEEDVAPAVEESPTRAVEEPPAPPRKRAAPARRKTAAPAAEKSAAPAARKRAPAKKKTGTAATRSRATPAKKTSTTTTRRTSASAAKPKTETAAKAKPKARATKKATAPAATPRRARRTSARSTAADAPATNGGASSDELARLRPELAAAVEALDVAVEALREDLKKARATTATKRQRRSTDSVSR
jgi:hypothetical protein